jgi:hypothetical protein
MPDRSRAVEVLRRVDRFIHAKLRALRATGAPGESVFVRAVEELHRILEERLPAAPEEALPADSGRAPRMAIRPRRAGRPAPPAGDAESTFVIDYSRELVCLTREGVRLSREGLAAPGEGTAGEAEGAA